LNYTNRGYGYAKGLDLFLKRNIGKLNNRFSYSYLVARRKSGNFIKLTPPDFDITHNITLVSSYQIFDWLAVQTAYRFATGKPYTANPDQYNTKRVPHYERIDLNLEYLHSFYEGNFTVFYIAISNLFNRINCFDYEYSKDYLRRKPVEGMKRTIYFGLSIKI